MVVIGGCVFLAARTTRAQCYAQAMADAGLAPEMTIIYGPQGGTLPGQAQSVPTGSVPDIFTPDLKEPLETTAARCGWHTEIIDTKNVNSPELAAAVAAHDPRLIIFTGFGGQIVREPLLGLGVPLLHVHPGWVPQFRGSTTIYYSYLAQGACAASAILLRERIDSGPVVARKRYAPPQAGIDVDHLYDGAIRADLLMDVLRTYIDENMVPVGEEQHTDGSDTAPFYIIHPVLKHIALLGRPFLNAPPSTPRR